MNQNVIDVGDRNFETEVVARSRKLPVVVDFWAPWCGPCRSLGPVLERLATEGGGAWVLAKVNVDENPQVSRQFGIRGIPAVKAFVDGRVVDELMGAQPEANVRRFLEGLASQRPDARLEQAAALLTAGKWQQAERLYRELLEATPGRSEALLGLGRALAEQGHDDEARGVLEQVPHGETAWPQAERILAGLAIKAEARELGGIAANRARLASDPQDLEGRYGLGVALAADGSYDDALRHLLTVLERDRSLRDGAARRAMIRIFTVLGGEHPLPQQYRTKMASVLY